MQFAAGEAQQKIDLVGYADRDPNDPTISGIDDALVEYLTFNLLQAGSEAYDFDGGATQLDAGISVIDENFIDSAGVHKQAVRVVDAANDFEGGQDSAGFEFERIGNLDSWLMVDVSPERRRGRKAAPVRRIHCLPPTITTRSPETSTMDFSASAAAQTRSRKHSILLKTTCLKGTKM